MGIINRNKEQGKLCPAQPQQPWGLLPDGFLGLPTPITGSTEMQMVFCCLEVFCELNKSLINHAPRDGLKSPRQVIAVQHHPR